ncbi:ribonuclease H [Trifolium pratense]|uniref:Ribonuclease H n=1 Tax=Trifolium pratense TaxID=57577 RepID=A0A2K3PD58_TRIPR|nr:ribonuclease H [Trifolium pratense]
MVTDEVQQLDYKAQLILSRDLLNQEQFWREKSQIQHFTLGDRNTSFFHRVARIKAVTKQIHIIHSETATYTTATDIEHHIVQYFQAIFCQNNVSNSGNIVRDSIPSIVTAVDNQMLTKVPYSDEIKAAIFEMNGDGAPGPDGFIGHFFQCYWNIIVVDVIKSVQHFFLTGVLHNINSNLLVLIPKLTEADRMENYRPIALTNFQFKIITKLSADRLALLAPSIISVHQHGFMPERNIADCVIVTSEAINVLARRAFAGSLALKIDQKKHWTRWIGAFFWRCCISSVSMIYFVGNPISPLLFCIAEEVLSRSLTKAMEDSKLCPMSLCRGQHINKAKSKFYAGSISNARFLTIINLLGFNTGTIPFTYLGCPVFIGKPKAIHFQALADKIKIKRATWKGSLLNIMGRVHLIRSVIHGDQISYRKDNWLGASLVDLLHIPEQVRKSLHTKVSDMIIDFSWIIPTPSTISALDPAVAERISAVVIPNQHLEDRLVWIDSKDGFLPSKLAYQFLFPPIYNLNWTDLVCWKNFVTPLSLLSICFCAAELVRWTALAVFHSCNPAWCLQVKEIALAAIIHTFHTIWMARNGIRFNIVNVSLHAAKIKIRTLIVTSGGVAKVTASKCPADLEILNNIEVPISQPPQPKITLVLWKAPIAYWIKVNTALSTLLPAVEFFVIIMLTIWVALLVNFAITMYFTQSSWQ